MHCYVRAEGASRAFVNGTIWEGKLRVVCASRTKTRTRLERWGPGVMDWRGESRASEEEKQRYEKIQELGTMHDCCYLAESKWQRRTARSIKASPNNNGFTLDFLRFHLYFHLRNLRISPSPGASPSCPDTEDNVGGVTREPRPDCHNPYICPVVTRFFFYTRPHRISAIYF